MKISKVKLLVAFLAFMVLAALLIMVSVESLGGGSFVCVNDTDMEITDLDVCVIDDEMFSIHDIYTGPVPKKDKLSADFEKKISIDPDITGELMVAVTFEGYEEPLYIFDGLFDKEVVCNLKLHFYEEDGEYYLTSKMGTPLFGSTKDTGVDSTYILDLEGLDYDWVD